MAKTTDCVRCGKPRLGNYGHTKTELGWICLACLKAWNRGEWTTHELRKQICQMEAIKRGDKIVYKGVDY